MNPSKVKREQVHQLTDLPNIGKAMAADLQRLGIISPKQLQGRDPYELYLALCELTGERQDPCVLDVFMAITRFADGAEPAPWWHYTAERKQRYRL
ncbi:helix-hairpin-helix domain-containing protein [Shewanella sp. YIC-542]|uniref:helix-hairpin-helix domain-containing protein n=1 Tax=Shewanella mytili TaxID=3377111 RepID=UPI00398F41ED